MLFKRLSFLAFLFALLVGNPARPAQARNVEPVKYWIFFADKADVAGKAPVAAVSPRSVGRRSTRGSAPIDQDLDRDVSSAYVARLLRLGVEPIVRSRWLNAVSAYLDEKSLAEVESLPFVLEVRPVGVARSHEAPAPFELGGVVRGIDVMTASSEPLAFNFGASLTQMTIAGAVQTVEAGWNGQGVMLGIIDTNLGDLGSHPALKPIADSGRLKGTRDFTGKLADGDRHARAVLSVAAGFLEGSLIGPAYAANILHARTEYVPTETNQEEDAFVAGIEWMESEGVDVVNVSLGYGEFDPGQRSYTYADMNGQTAVTTLAAERAVSLGVVVVASAGNEGCSSPSLCWYYIGSPADGPSVITAGGVAANRTKSSFSSMGPTADGRFKPNVSALAGESLGIGVYFANGGSGFSYGNGTSFASPMIAGIVAQMLQADETLTPLQVREILQNTASQSSAPDNRLGWGIVNAGAALASITARESSDVPGSLFLTAWPNPFENEVHVTATLPAGMAEARLDLVDALGRTIATYRAPAASDGSWRITVDTASLAPGLVLYRLSSGNRFVTGSLVHVR